MYIMTEEETRAYLAQLSKWKRFWVQVYWIAIWGSIMAAKNMLMKQGG